MSDVLVNRLARPYEFRTSVPGREYAALVLSNDPTQNASERDKISVALVASGCRYAVCSGCECSKWDGAIDLAFLEISPNFDPPAEKFVMTSWH